MRKERYKYMQIGKTCGFYSIGCCLDELYGLDDPLGFISIMVENCKYSGLTVVGEVFDIDLLLDIAKTFIPRDIKVSKIKLNAAEVRLRRNRVSCLSYRQEAALCVPMYKW